MSLIRKTRVQRALAKFHVADNAIRAHRHLKACVCGENVFCPTGRILYADLYKRLGAYDEAKLAAREDAGR